MVWPTLAFEADLIDWSYPFPPPHGRQRHHIKIATAVDKSAFELELTMRLEPGEKVQLFWSAIGAYALGYPRAAN